MGGRSLAKVLIMVSLCIVVGAFLFFLFRPGPAPPPQQEAREAPKAGPEGAEVHGMAVTTVPQEPTPTKGEDPCAQVVRGMEELMGFIKENQAFRALYRGGDSKDFMSQVVIRLGQRLPYMGQEEAQVFSSSFHLFRVLGSKDLRLLKGLLDQGPESLEVMCKDIYQWLTSECVLEGLRKPEMGMVISYASFLLGTKAGKGYLERRKGILGFLARYYSILILKKFGKWDPSMEGHVRYCITYLEGTKGLLFAEEYSKNLRGLIKGG